MRWIVVSLALWLSACAKSSGPFHANNSAGKLAKNEVEATDPISLQELWTLHGVFNQPESAAFDPVSQQIFVSNVNGYAKDGNGFVSRVSADGQDLDLRWLDKLDSPTGVTVAGDFLYVVDFDQLLKIDIKNQQITNRYPAPHSNPALNDVLVTSNGDVYVSGSSSSAIYRLEGDTLVTWKQDVELLKHANGLFQSEDSLLFGGARWLSFDLRSGDVISTDIGLSEIDGIAEDGCAGVIVSLIDDNRLWWLPRDRDARPLNEAAVGGIDLSFHEGKLYVPRVGGSLSVYAMSSEHCQPQS